MSNFRRMLMMLAQDLPKRESFQYGDEIISQDAYDYTLSFGKKAIKDLKKVIEQSDDPALLIKRINDWKYLIHSLVDTGYTSWLKGDGSAWIDTDMEFGGETYYEIKFIKQTENVNNKIHFFGNGNAPRHHIGYLNTPTIALYYRCDVDGTPTDKFTSLLSSNVSGSHVIGYKNDNYIVVDNNAVPLVGKPIFGGKVNIFKAYSKAIYGEEDISYIDIETNDIHKKFVPYYNGSEYCMLDINSGTIHENANVVDGVKVGAFSWMLTNQEGKEIYNLH